MFISISITIALIICYILSFKYFKGEKNSDIRYTIILLIVIMMIVNFAIYSSNQNYVKQYIQKKKLIAIFSHKTKHPKDKAFLYGLVINKYGYTLNQTIINCYDKFHSFKETRTCVNF